MLFTRKQSTRYPQLFVKKYRKKVFYDNLWNSELIEARGHVELEDGTLVVAPFTKVFNRFENGTNIDIDNICLGVQKINGFMAAVTYVPQVKDVVISTTGSLDSEYVDIASKYFSNKFRKYVKEYGTYTFLFEICDPEDPHIIPEEFGAYLIGIRNINVTDTYYSTIHTERVLDSISNKFGFIRPDYHVATFRDLLRKVEKATNEGMVIYSLGSPRLSLKLKSPYYLGLKMLARSKDISRLDIKRVPEEFQPLLNYIITHKVDFNRFTEQEKLKYLTDQYNYLYK